MTSNIKWPRQPRNTSLSNCFKFVFRIIIYMAFALSTVAFGSNPSPLTTNMSLRGFALFQ